MCLSRDLMRHKAAAATGERFLPCSTVIDTIYLLTKTSLRVHEKGGRFSRRLVRFLGCMFGGQRPWGYANRHHNYAIKTRVEGLHSIGTLRDDAILILKCALKTFQLFHAYTVFK